MLDIYVKDFINLNDFEIDLVLNARNEEKVRKMCKNQNIISRQEHIDFIKSLHNNNAEKFFLVYVDSEPIGVISFTNIQEKKSSLGEYSIKSSVRFSSVILNYIQFYYAFEILKLDSIVTEILDANKKLIPYQLELNNARYGGVLKDFATLLNGEKMDAHIIIYDKDKYVLSKENMITNIKELLDVDDFRLVFC